MTTAPFFRGREDISAANAFKRDRASVIVLMGLDGQDRHAPIICVGFDR
jgi:hypothetical protein